MQDKSQKLYYQQNNIGRAKYTVSYHNGADTHRDGSPFYGIYIFNNKKELAKCLKRLAKDGYKEKAY